MEFLHFIKHESSGLNSRFLAVAVLAGVANGLLIAVLIAATGATQGSSEQVREFVLFALLFVLYISTRKHILDRTSMMMEQIIESVRVRLMDKVRRTELPAFENIGTAYIQQTVLQDARTISDAASVIASAFSSMVLVAVAMLYIALLSLSTFVVVVGATGTMVFMYISAHKSIQRQIETAWGIENRFFDAVNDQLEGFKQLKMDARKGEDLFTNDIQIVAADLAETNLKTARNFNWNVVFGQSFFFALIAMVVFLLPGFLDQEQLPVGKIVAVILFVMGPLSEIVAALPALTKANVAAVNVTNFEAKLEKMIDEPPEGDTQPAAFAQLACQNLMFRYPDTGDRRPFQVGPLDLSIEQGEIVFLVGGNGTGKSTLLRLLCGLQWPTAGRITVDDELVTRSRIVGFRQRFAVIWQDFRLFRRLLGVPEIDHARADDLLTMLQIDEVTHLDRTGHFSSLDLSTGQRKRLALFVAELDDKEIYIFDEWAADQDPEFRKYFYEVYLAQLRARGKTVIAATHDDHYFYVADRVIKMTDGQIADLAADSLFRPPGVELMERSSVGTRTNETAGE